MQFEGKEIYEVITLGNPKLREKSKPVENIPRVKKMCRKLLSTIRYLGGVGIAAPMVGENIRMFVVDNIEENKELGHKESSLYVVINPEILEYSEEKETDWEGSFSLPGLAANVSRPESILMRYYSIDGYKCEERFEGYLARVMQHEYDYLEGVVYLDKLESAKDLFVENVGVDDAKKEGDKIVKIADLVLRQKCEPVKDLKAAKTLYVSMVEILKETGGVGLAAPQVGDSSRMFVVKQKEKYYAVVNPEITFMSEDMEEDWEECLSAPGYSGKVSRHKSIKIKYQTLDGKEKEDELKGFSARVMQHEYDHLDGIVYIDRLENLSSLVKNENIELNT